MAGPGPILRPPPGSSAVHLPINFQNPPDFGLGPGANSTSPQTGSQATGGDDWSHLLTRIAEFTVGAILIAVGINYLFLRSKTGQTVVNIAAGTATGGAGKVARATRTAQRP